MRARLCAEGRLLMFLTAALLVAGAMAVYSASGFASMRYFGNSHHYFAGHLLRTLVGILLGVCAWKIGPGFWKAVALPLYLLSLALVLVTIIPSCPIAPSINGSSRWIVAGPVKIMPSELVRFSFVILVATLVTRGSVSPRTLRGVAIISFLGSVPAAMYLLQPDYAGAAFLVGTVLVMLYISEARFSHLLLLVAAAAVLLGVFVVSTPYRADRVRGWLNQGQEVNGDNFQPEQSCIALGSGGILGRGLGRGRQQRGFLPEAFTDFIFAVIGEETGFAGSIAVLLAFFALFSCAWRISAKADDAFGSLVAGGLTASIMGAFLIHVGVCLRLLPATGMTLPLVSWGGTSMMTTLVSLGVIARVATGVRR
ncbi:FtsW/RodA/SpoVE family cell cycle protein [Candidatus Fermentibacteria bacterium]|nr:FtsW/RodA/SpoVE family cell cycle protein [Candidatus Fermentibacteria bacterium]